MLRAYYAAALTLNLVRSFSRGGLADLRQAHAWNADFVRRSPAGQRYESMATDIDRALAFMRACGVDLDAEGSTHGVDLFASHEALLLEYESALVRRDEVTGRPYDLSGHMVWIGDRTRQLDGAHVDLISQIANPVGLKLGPTVRPEEAAALVERLDPDGLPGRLTVITRMGADARGRPAAAGRREGDRDRSRGGLGLRSDARQHHGVLDRPQDPALRRRRRRGDRVLRRAPRARHRARRHPRRADR